MAHFALLDDNNVVLYVMVVDNENLLDENGMEQEAIGLAYIRDVLRDDARWVQTSYNATFRGELAGIGYTYDEVLDKFIPALDQPYD
jgi:hypothetical protein